MNVRTVCYFGLSREPKRLASILALLPDEMKADCDRVLEELKEKESVTWRAEWITARKMERKLLAAAVDKGLGGKTANLQDALRQHLLRRASTRR